MAVTNKGVSMAIPDDQSECAVEATVAVIGGKWKPILLFHLVAGPKRFSELQRLLPQASDRMLMRSLRELERDRLIIRKVFAEVPARVEYSLTKDGFSLVPVLNAMSIAGSVVTNVPMREAIDVATERVREGASIGKSLAVSKLFPPVTMRLIQSGEASGELEKMLERTAISQEQEVETLRKMLTSLLAPFMVLVMGGIVLTIVMAILLPIFELNTNTAF